MSFKDLLTALSDSPKKTSDTCGQTGKPNLSFYISSSDTSLLPSQPHLPALQPSALPAVTPKPAELPDVQNHSRLYGCKHARDNDSITKQNFHLIWDHGLEHDLCILLCFFSFFFLVCVLYAWCVNTVYFANSLNSCVNCVFPTVNIVQSDTTCFS